MIFDAGRELTWLGIMMMVNAGILLLFAGLLYWGARNKHEEITCRTIQPIGTKIIEHPKLNEWIARGQASQQSDGLWLHYSVVCTLLREMEQEK